MVSLYYCHVQAGKRNPMVPDDNLTIFIAQHIKAISILRMESWALNLPNTMAVKAKVNRSPFALVSWANCRPENSNGPIESTTGGMPRGEMHATDGDGTLGDSDEGDDDEAHPAALTNGTTSGQKKKRKSKKSKKKASKKQSSPPRVPLSQLFPQGKYPVGEVQHYESDVENTSRTTAKELRYMSYRHLEDDSFLDDYRKAAEVHRQVRKWTQEHVKPGQGLMSIAEDIDDGVRSLLGHAGLEPGDSLKAGLGFPTGLSLNNVVAHYTPNPGHKDIILQSSDVMKVDFGVHINGWIVDSAFTMSFDPVYDNLLAAVKDATNTGLKVRYEAPNLK